MLPVLREGADLGIGAYVMLTAGFGETGTEGARRENVDVEELGELRLAGHEREEGAAGHAEHLFVRRTRGHRPAP